MAIENVKIGKNEYQYERLDQVVAARGAPALGEKEVLDAVLPKLARSPFENAGWRFLQSTGGYDQQHRPVYMDQNGGLFIDSGRVTLRLLDVLTDEQIAEFFTEQKFESYTALGIAKNVFDARVPAGESAVTVAGRLTGDRRLEWIEPSLIEQMGSRR